MSCYLSYRPCVYTLSDHVLLSVLQAIGPVGGLFGGPISGPVSDRLGRSAALVLMTIPHLIGWLLQAYAQYMPSFAGFTSILMLGRWFTGFGTGWGSLVISVRYTDIAVQSVGSKYPTAHVKLGHILGPHHFPLFLMHAYLYSCLMNDARLLVQTVKVYLKEVQFHVACSLQITQESTVIHLILTAR